MSFVTRATLFSSLKLGTHYTTFTVFSDFEKTESRHEWKTGDVRLHVLPNQLKPTESLTLSCKVSRGQQFDKPQYHFEKIFLLFPVILWYYFLCLTCSFSLTVGNMNLQTGQLTVHMTWFCSDSARRKQIILIDWDWSSGLFPFADLCFYPSNTDRLLCQLKRGLSLLVQTLPRNHGIACPKLKLSLSRTRPLILILTPLKCKM